MRSIEELEKELEIQLRFLVRSAQAFDEGDQTEARRMATTIRLLVHDTRNSKSLLDQLDMKIIGFNDTAGPPNYDNKIGHLGLLHLRLSSKFSGFVPSYDEGPYQEGLVVSFDYWWKEQVVLIDRRSQEFTRKDLVLSVADQDGGAHLDPIINESYKTLSRDNSIGWISAPINTPLIDVFMGKNTSPANNPVPPCIRQITHELIKSIRLRKILLS